MTQIVSNESIAPVPTWLEVPPEADVIEPPIDTLIPELPIERLRWEDFERLCLRLARTQADVVGARLYGTAGQDQQGIDLFARITGPKPYRVYQCKRVEEFSPAVIREAVADFLAGIWANRTAELVLCTTDLLRTTHREEAFEAERMRLAAQGLILTPWTRAELSDLLRAQPQIVHDFFGQMWVKRFCGEAAALTTEARLAPRDVYSLRRSLRDLYRTVFAIHDPGLTCRQDEAPVTLYERYVAHDLIETVVEQSQPAHGNPGRAAAGDRGQQDEQQLDSVPTARHRRTSLEDSIATNPNGVRIYLGGPGSGKSALLRYIALDLLNDTPRLTRVAQVWGRRVPVWIPFGAWVDRIERGDRQAPISTVVREWLTQWEAAYMFPLVEQALEDKKLLLLVDGLDEWTSQGAARLAIAQLRAFAERQGVPIVLTSRPHGFKSLSDVLPAWPTQELAPLSRTQQLDIAERWFEQRNLANGPDPTQGHAARQQGQDAIAELQRVTDLAALAEVPFLLAILLLLQAQNVELPTNRFRAYAELTRHLMVIQPRRRALSAQQTGRLSTLEEQELETCYGYLAFRLHKDSPTGIISVSTARSHLEEALRSEAFGIGFPLQEANRIARDLIDVGESVSGVLVKRSPTDLGFYHRVIQEHLAASHLSTLSDIEQVETVALNAADPQWREVILALVVRSSSQHMVAKLLQAIETSSATSPAVKQLRAELLTEIASGPAQCPYPRRRALLEQACEAVELHWSSSHRHTLTRFLVAGIRRQAVKTTVLPRLRRWFPSRFRFRSHLITATTAWPEDSLWELVQRVLVNDEDEANQLAASQVISARWGSDVSKRDALASLARSPHSPTARAAMLMALIEGFDAVTDAPSILAAQGTRLSPELRLVSILARLKHDVRRDGDRDQVLQLLNFQGLHYSWWPIATAALAKHWPIDIFVRDGCIRAVRGRGAIDRSLPESHVAWKILLDGYPHDDLVAEALIAELDQRYPQFAQVDWFVLGRQFHRHRALAARLESWIDEHDEDDFLHLSEVSGAATVGCTDHGKARLLGTLGKTSQCFWSARALLTGWGIADPDVAPALNALARGPNRQAGWIAHLIPDIITDPVACRARLYDLLSDPAVDRADFVLSGLSRLGELRLDDRFPQVALQRLADTRGHVGKALRGALIRSHPGALGVRELALEALNDHETEVLSAVIEGFAEDHVIRDQIAERLTPLASDFRMSIAEGLLRSGSSDPEVLGVCRSFIWEDEREIATTTAVARYRSIQAAGMVEESDIDLLRTELRAVGSNYDSRRQAAYASTLELERYALIDECDETGPLTVSLGDLNQPNPLLNRQVVSHWTRLAERYPDAVLSRFQRNDHPGDDQALPQSAWSTIVTEMDGRSDADKALQRALAAWNDELLEPPLLRYLARTEPGSLRLRAHCLRALTADTRSWNMDGLVGAVAEILATQFREDNELWHQVENELRGTEFATAAFVALARTRPSNDVLFQRGRGAIDDPSGVSLHVVFTATCVAGTTQEIIQCINQYWGRGEIAGRWLLQPLVERLARDEATRFELAAHALQQESQSACVSISIALAAASPLDQALSTRLRGLLDAELESGAIASFTFDSRSGTVRALAAVLTEILSP